MAELTTNTNTVETNGAAAEAESSSTPKTYTQDEVDALLQAESDRRVNQALKKQEAKNAEKVREAQKLANMDAQQKYEYELNQREAAIAAKEKELALAENTNVASKILSEKGLSLDLVKFVVAEDAETMDANIKALDRAFKNSVKNEVEKRLGGAAAPKRVMPDLDTITKDQFKKMSLAEMNELARTNRELYDSLIKG